MMWGFLNNCTDGRLEFRTRDGSEPNRHIGNALRLAQVLILNEIGVTIYNTSCQGT
jgi:hypothetical protein